MLPTTSAYGGYDALGYGYGSVLGQSLGLFMGLILWPIVLVIFGWVLYYFSGKDKKIDGVLPHLMASAVRVFTYIWLLIMSLVAYVGLSSVFFFVFDNILAGGGKAEGSVLLNGLVLALLMAGLAAVVVMFNRKVMMFTKVGGTISTKMFAMSGLVVFSIAAFIFVTLFVMQIVSIINQDVKYLDPSTVSGVFSSVVMLGVYVWKTMKVAMSEK